MIYNIILTGYNYFLGGYLLSLLKNVSGFMFYIKLFINKITF